MTEPTLAAKADYADAILVARRAKNWLFLLLLVVLLGQIALFFVARSTTALDPLMSTATTQPTQLGNNRMLDGLKYLVALCGFAGLSGSLVLCAMLMLLVKIMLTGRTLGVAKVTSAFVWSVVLLVLLFPWQAILANPTVTAQPDAMAKDYKIPGVLFTWAEFSNPASGAKFHADRIDENILRWARFVGFPVLATMILLSIQVKSSKGIKSALGEDISAINRADLA